MESDNDWESAFARIAHALERIADTLAPAHPLPALDGSCYVWRSDWPGLQDSGPINALDMSALCGVDSQSCQLWQNTLAFARSGVGNHALLWGSRGAGKSSLVKSCIKRLHDEFGSSALPVVRLVEVSRDSIATLPALFDALQLLRKRLQQDYPDHVLRVIIYLDDLSFGSSEAHHRVLKSALEGSIRSPGTDTLVYATSNRRHLISRDLREQNNPLRPREDIDDQISLSDRFGLWLGFATMNQDQYLEAANRHLRLWGVDSPPPDWRHQALTWSRSRGGLSGRVAMQFARSIAATQASQLP